MPGGHPEDLSNGPSREAVLAWLQARIGRPLTPAEQADVLAAAGAEGEAADRLIAAFAAEFHVDMTGYSPEAHRDASATQQPGWPIRRLPPLGLRLPIPVSLLHASALAGRWVERLPDLRPARSAAWANLPLLLVGLPVLTALLLALLF